jgi:DNA ligase (NAD+)
MSVDQEVLELEQVITHLDTCYEAGDDCIHPITNKLVSDPEYDLLRKRLQQLAPNSPVLADVTASTLNNAGIKKVKHYPPMTSISKAIGTLDEREATLKDWLGKIKVELNYPDPAAEVVQAYKRDGVALALYYEKGKLKSAGLRPRDGQNGEDVTANVRYVEGIPTELWEHDRDGNRVRFLPVTCCIRGEIECKKSTFRKIAANWQTYHLSNEPANPRNYAAGSIRQFFDPKITKEREISFTAYSIWGWTSADPQLANAPYKTEVERAKYSNQVLRVPFVRVMPFRQKDLQALEDLSPSLDYEVDGIVLSVNNLEDSEQMGTHGNSITGNPKGKLAWKFAEESAVVTVKKYEFTPGRSGKLTPVISFDAVPLDGTQVSQVTGHSLGFMDGSSTASLGEIGVGARIRVIKSGKIIPKIIEIVQRGQKFKAPHQCPSCNSKLEIRQGTDGKDLVCENEFCGDRAVSNLCYYLTTVGAKGVADSTVGKLLEKQLVQYPCDFYALTMKDLRDSGLSDRQATLALARIWMVDDPAHKDDDDLHKLVKQAQADLVTIPAWQLLAAQGIPNAGKTASQALLSHFGNLDAVVNASLADLESVGDIGSVTAASIHAYFKKYKKYFEKLLKYVKPEGPKQGKFTGTSFVFTGGFPGGKAKWEKAVMEEGGKCSGSVSKTTNYVVVGTDAGSKEEKAKQLGIKRISLTDLEVMLK